MDAIWQQAKADLTILTRQGELDPLLWEHAERVARSADLILGMLGAAASEVDPQAMRAAALYQDVGWVVQYEEGSIEHDALLSHPLSDLERALGAARARQCLQGIVSGHHNIGYFTDPSVGPSIRAF